MTATSCLPRFLVAGAITRLAPLNWVGPAISLVVLQLLASLALLRSLYVILVGGRCCSYR